MAVLLSLWLVCRRQVVLHHRSHAVRTSGRPASLPVFQPGHPNKAMQGGARELR